MKKLALFFILVLFASTLHAQNIWNFSKGNFGQEAVTSSINGDFLSLNVQGGFTPLSFSDGVLDWGGPAIETVGLEFWKGSVFPNNGVVGCNPAWWIGPEIGAGQYNPTASQVITHGIVGLNEGLNLGSAPFTANEVIDTDTGKFYFGLALNTQLDFGGSSIVQVH